MAEKILSVADLSKQYGGKYVVDHVTMSIDRGDICGFIGVNGAGKTTFMRMVCGLVKPSEGSMELFGEKGTKALEKARHRTGALIEHPALYTNMSAMENLEIQRRYLDADFGKGARQAMEELLELVGLKDIGKKRVGTFSMGMKQRLGLALALLGRPEFVILDEPYVGLDPVGVAELRELLIRLNKDNGLTILFSSHNLDQMTRLATEYVFLHEGRLRQSLSAVALEQECTQRGESLEEYFVGRVRVWGRKG